MDNSNRYIEQAAIEKLHDAIRTQKQCNELAEHLNDSLLWVLHFCQKNNIPLPNLEKIRNIIDKTLELEMVNQPTKNSDKNNRLGHRTCLMVLLPLRGLLSVLLCGWSAYRLII